MHLTIPRAALLPALTRAAQVADSKSTLPILACALLRADAKRLTVAGSDLNLHAATTLPATIRKAGAICLDAKRLTTTVANLPEGDIDLTVDGTVLVIKAGRSTTRLVGMTATDYPKLPDERAVAYVAVSGPDVAALLDRTLFSVCRDETRLHLASVYLDARGPTTMVSTDGHRLSKAVRPLAAMATGAEGVILPKAGAAALLKLARDATSLEWGLGGSPRHLFARVDGAVLAIKLLDVVYPPFAQVIPGPGATRVTVDRATLIAAVKRCGLLASDTRGLTLTVDAEADDPLVLASDNPDAGDVREGIDAEVAGPALKTGCAPKFLADALNAMTADRVTIDLKGALDAWLVRGVGNTEDEFVIMPMRLP